MHPIRILTPLALFLQAALALPQAPPAPAAPALPATMPAVAPTPAAAPHTLQAVRLRPMADSYRLIFLFDRVAPYTLREDLVQQRATIEFMNSTLSSLPSELAQLKDPHLSGIWLKQHDGGLVTLELRFPSAAMRMEHFSLDDPPAVVVDLYRTDGDVVRLNSAPAESTVSTTGASSSEGPAVPLSGAPRIFSGARGSILPQAATGAGLSTATLQTSHTAAAEPTATEAPNAANLNGEPTVQTAALRRGEAGPLDADYEYFPLSALKLQSPAGKAIREAFQARRWATVVKDGLLYLEYNRINPETGDILFMIAESKWQLSKSPNQSVADMLNLYQQASRTDDRGDLGAFSAYRQAQAHLLLGDWDSALLQLERAAGSSQEAIRQRSLLMRIQALDSLRRYQSALVAVQEALKTSATNSERANLYVREGNIKTSMGNYTGAWDSFVEATRANPEWLPSNLDGAKALARAAMESGRYDYARKTVTYLIDSKYFAEEEQWNLTLLYAEILTRQKDLKFAEEVYFVLFRMAQTEKGKDVRRKMLAVYPNDLVDSEGRYCILLVMQGKVPQAMNELNRAYFEALHDGAPAERLAPAMQVVVPLYLDYAVAHDMPIEAINTWKYYSHATSSAPLRRRCLAPLSAAFEKIELYNEALPLVRELRHDLATTTSTLSALDLEIAEARLEIKLKNPGAAIPLLEGIQQARTAPEHQGELYELLADAYQKSGRPLEAAQALQSLADIGGIALARRNEILCQAGEIFLGKGMPRQTIELGLKGLLFEKQALEKASGLGDDAAGGYALRLMLAKAYLATGDLARQHIVLEDLLRRTGLSVEQKTLAEIMLSNNQRQTDQLSDVEQLYQTIRNDPAADADWRKSAEQMQRIMDWNRRHPDQQIDLK